MGQSHFLAPPKGRQQAPCIANCILCQEVCGVLFSAFFLLGACQRVRRWSYMQELNLCYRLQTICMEQLAFMHSCGLKDTILPFRVSSGIITCQHFEGLFQKPLEKHPIIEQMLKVCAILQAQRSVFFGDMSVLEHRMD